MKKTWSNDSQVMGCKVFPPYWSDMIKYFESISKNNSAFKSKINRSSFNYNIKSNLEYLKPNSNELTIDNTSDSELDLALDDETMGDEIMGDDNNMVSDDTCVRPLKFKRDSKLKINSKSNSGYFKRFINNITNTKSDQINRCEDSKIYAINIYDIPHHFKNMSHQTISICYPGGFVLPLDKRVLLKTPCKSRVHFDTVVDTLSAKNEIISKFDWLDLHTCTNTYIERKKRVLEDYETVYIKSLNRERGFSTHDDYVMPHVVDFNSLYPYSMVWRNVCFSTCCYNPKFKVLINGKYYDPFDKSVIDQIACPIKINSKYTHCTVFIIKPLVKISVLASDFIKFNNMRKGVKLRCEESVRKGDFAQATVLNFLQSKIKLVVNSIYGVLNAELMSTFRPWLSSLVTYFGRTNLLRFNLFFIRFCEINKLDMKSRFIAYGDTDSAFIMCTKMEVNELLNQFNNLSHNRGVIKIVCERSADLCIIFKKKKYIIYEIGKNLYLKNIMTSDKSKPCSTFLKDFFYIVIDYLLKKYSTLDEIRSKLHSIFKKFCSYHESEYMFSMKLSKDLEDYKPSKRRILVQMKMVAEKYDNITYKKGTLLEYTHYDYIFDDCEYRGKVDKLNEHHLKYIDNQLTKGSTILINDAKLIFNQDECKYEVCKHRIFDQNARCIIENLFGPDNVTIFSDLINCFRELYKQSFDIAFDKQQRFIDARGDVVTTRKRKSRADAVSGKIMKIHTPTILEFMERNRKKTKHY